LGQITPDKEYVLLLDVQLGGVPSRLRFVNRPAPVRYQGHTYLPLSFVIKESQGAAIFLDVDIAHLASMAPRPIAGEAIVSTVTVLSGLLEVFSSYRFLMSEEPNGRIRLEMPAP
jgi:hypothetical protein